MVFTGASLVFVFVGLVLFVWLWFCSAFQAGGKTPASNSRFTPFLLSHSSRVDRPCPVLARQCRKKMAFLCMFLLHFNDEHHDTVTMTIASFFCCTLLACHEGRGRSPSVSEMGEKTDFLTFQLNCKNIQIKQRCNKTN